MKTTVTLELKTREVHHLFKRKISSSRLFIDAILHKLNKLIGLRKKGLPETEEHYQVIKQHLNDLNQYLEAEAKRFQEFVQKDPLLKNKTISFKAQFFPEIRVENSLTVTLIACIEQYDKLITIIKLLYLAGYFKSTQDYYANIKRTQKIANQALSKIILSDNLYKFSKFVD